MNPAQFVEKWRGTELSERAASHEHFIDLCHLLGQPTPAAVDKTGAEYAFEKGVADLTDPEAAEGKIQRGFADVWWRSKFGWEYKRKDKHKNLDAAYAQLCKYREALENPPLLIVSDIARTEIHTNFTGTKKEVHAITLEEMGEPRAIDLLRRVFVDPNSFRPTETTEGVTALVAKWLGDLAQRLRDRGHDPLDVAHFLMKVMFCLFAEDVDLLPRDRFKSLLDKAADAPTQLTAWLNDLFTAMKSGGFFWGERIAHFNGGLFDDAPALELLPAEIDVLRLAAAKYWGAVEPAIFGTLFERSLDPDKRAQIGAHYTSREDILLVVEPVIMDPLRREWDAVRTEIEKQLERRRAATTRETKKKADDAIEAAFRAFLDRLAAIRILDPACGSGNFLYVAIQRLLDLEREVITFAARGDIGLGLFPNVRPTQLHGIEINPYAAELAQVVIWIGYLQWMRDNGFNVPRDPILEPLQTIEERDAILAWKSPDGNPLRKWQEGAVCTGPATWPDADYIIGNPPFLGDKRMVTDLGENYSFAARGAFAGRVPGGADLCCFWFEVACFQVSHHHVERVGLLARNSIRFGANREVLERISDVCEILFAWSDKKWMLDGAATRISIVGFGLPFRGEEKRLDGRVVSAINVDLTSGLDVTNAVGLDENQDLCFIGTQKSGDFDLEWTGARHLLAAGGNPDGRTNVEVIAPWLNGTQVTKRPLGTWIIDFGAHRDLDNAARFERPFEYVAEHVKPAREGLRRKNHRVYWWRFGEARPGMRTAIGPLARFLLTPRVAKHRTFVFADRRVVPDSRLCVIARDDDYALGVLQSDLHELWSLAQASWHGVGNDPTYNAQSCFETFPLPWPPGAEDTTSDAHMRVSAAAKELDSLRERWLNPPEWIDEIEAQVDRADDFADVASVSGEEARQLIRQSAIMARAAQDKRLKKRTLTNLYNERPTWLKEAHKALDQAVLAAYAVTNPEAPHPWDETWADVWYDTGAGRPLPEGHPLGQRRTQVDEMVLANLLALNKARAAK